MGLRRSFVLSVFARASRKQQRGALAIQYSGS